MTDFTESLRKLVEDAATRVAEGVLQRGLALVEDLQQRADALLRDAEFVKVRWDAIKGIVEAAQSAAAEETMLRRATRVYISTVSAGPGREIGLGDASIRLPASDLDVRLVPWGEVGLPAGRYTIVVAFYRQGA